MQQADGQRHPQAPRELESFAFLVGKWSCHVKALDEKGEWVDMTATWHGRYILDGWAIADEFRMYDAEGDLVMLGCNYRAYDEASDRWEMRWLDPRSCTWLVLGSEELGGVDFVDGTIRLVTEFQPGELHRITFSDISTSGFRWEVSRSLDGGETWDGPGMTIEARREA